MRSVYYNCCVSDWKSRYKAINHMEVHIFDVEHGSCAAVIAPSGKVLLLDAGHNASSGWRPSNWIAARGGVVDCLVISNFDEDHLTDLPNILAGCLVRSFVANWSVSPEWIRRSKAAFGMGPGVHAAVHLLENRVGYDPSNPSFLIPATPVDWGGCHIEHFWHTPAQFSDENALSVVTFVQWGGVRLVFPGYLTTAAWGLLLWNPRFRELLASTNIFVASHHGRTDGYCPEVFSVCQPHVIVISDKGVMYDTQTVDYSRHATGIAWDQTQVRRCLTTRNDGTLCITPTGTGFYIQAG